jgi:hypothetical protein
MPRRCCNRSFGLNGLRSLCRAAISGGSPKLTLSRRSMITRFRLVRNELNPSWSAFRSELLHARGRRYHPMSSRMPRRETASRRRNGRRDQTACARHAKSGNSPRVLSNMRMRALPREPFVRQAQTRSGGLPLDRRARARALAPVQRRTHAQTFQHATALSSRMISHSPIQNFSSPHNALYVLGTALICARRP